MPEPEFEICIVEDDDSAGRALGRLVRSFGYRFHTYHSAAALLEGGRLEKADCILLDVNLPGMSGLELQQRMHDEDVNTPIIFLTGHGDVPTSVGAMKAGAIDFLQKPVAEGALLDALARAMSIRLKLKGRNGERKRALDDLHILTKRELQVFRCLSTGAMNKQIAWHLNIAEKTVKVHRGNINKKLDAKSIVDLIGSAQLTGIEPDRDLKR